VSEHIPYMPLFVNDFLANTEHMSPEATGALICLLCRSWSSGGALPTDDAVLARWARMLPDQWAAAKPAITQAFVLRSGRYVHEPTEQQHTKFIEGRRRMAEGGRRGGLKTQGTLQGTLQKPLQGSIGLDCIGLKSERSEDRNEGTPVPEQSVGLGVQGEGAEPEATAVEMRIDELQEAYPRKTGHKAARAAIARALQAAQYEALLAAVKRFAKSVEGKDQKYIPAPAKWFEEERWRDKPLKDATPEAYDEFTAAGMPFKLKSPTAAQLKEVEDYTKELEATAGRKAQNDDAFMQSMSEEYGRGDLGLKLVTQLRGKVK
jgi:uncharacterized protein YdaU (DUF1376 family)